MTCRLESLTEKGEDVIVIVFFFIGCPLSPPVLCRSSYRKYKEESKEDGCRENDSNSTESVWMLRDHMG